MKGYKDSSVVFKVLTDGRAAFDSGVMRIDTPAKRASVPLARLSELRLVVTGAGDGISCDHADWAEAVIVAQPELTAAARARRGSKVTAKANLFEVPGGYALPVTFGGKAATIRIRGIAGLESVELRGNPSRHGEASLLDRQVQGRPIRACRPVGARLCDGDVEKVRTP